MDDGQGRMRSFEDGKALERLMKQFPESPTSKDPYRQKGVFYVGEELEIKGSKFKVKDISPFGIKLKLLKQK